MIDDLSWAEAGESDRLDLRRFICGDDSDPYVQEIHRYVRTRALDDHLFPPDADADLRLLAFRGEPGHRLIAVAVHDSNSRVQRNGELVPGTEVRCVAVALAVQGDQVHGRSLFLVVMDAVAQDVASRRRGELVYFLVHEANVKMLAIARDAGIFEEQETMMDYVVFVGRL